MLMDSTTWLGLSFCHFLVTDNLYHLGLELNTGIGPYLADNHVFLTRLTYYRKLVYNKSFYYLNIDFNGLP